VYRATYRLSGKAYEVVMNGRARAPASPGLVHEPECVVPAICSAHRVPQTGKTRARLGVGLTNGVGPTPCLLMISADVGSLDRRRDAGLRRVFRDRDGLLHTVVSANSRHHGGVRS
jgi:hypothetical protein